MCSPVYLQRRLAFLGLIPLLQTPKVFPMCSLMSCSHPCIDHARFYGFASGPLLIILSAVYSVPMTGWFLSPNWTLTGASVLCLQCQAALGSRVHVQCPMASPGDASLIHSTSIGVLCPVRTGPDSGIKKDWASALQGLRDWEKRRSRQVG